MSNITTATFNGESRRALTCPLYQYDYGQILQISGLELPASYQVHFANNENQGEASIVIGNADGASIPNELLQTGKDVWAFIFLNTTADDGETEYVIHIPVIKRPVPEEYEPTQEEQSIVTQLLGAVGSLGTEVGELRSDLTETNTNIGDLADLDTEDKSSLVAAINEAAQIGGGGGGGSSVSPYTGNPAALGTASPGSSARYSRGDHVHPSNVLKVTVTAAGTPAVYTADKTYAEIKAILDANGLVEVMLGGYTYRYETQSTVGAMASISFTNTRVASGFIITKRLTITSADSVTVRDTQFDMVLESLEDVEISGYVNGNLLVYNQSDDVWEDKSPSAAGLQTKTEEVNVATSGAVTQALEAGKVYHFTSDAITGLTITLTATSELAQYHFDFISPATPVVFSLPASVIMPSSFAVEAGKRYEIDILNNYGVVQSWDWSAS